MGENLPPGFRFHPTDEELITYYLTHKVSDINFTARAIAEVDLNKCEPWDLPGMAKMGEKEWYFFNLRDRKYPTGFRTNRATDAGYWKTTGKDKEIFNSGVLVGMKKTLVFYRGRAPKGEKTNWVMHEYRLQTKFIYKSAKEQWVVCRIFQKSSGGKRQSSNPSPSFPTFLESPCNNTIASEPGEIGSLESDCFSNPNPSPNPNPNFSDLNRLVRSDFNFNNINNNSNLVNMNITWPSLSLPASLLNLNFPYPNPNIMKALELNMKNSFQPQEASNNGLNSLVAPGDFYSGINFNTKFSAGAAAADGSSSKLLNPSRQTPLDLWCELGDYEINTSTHENPSICNLEIR